MGGIRLEKALLDALKVVVGLTVAYLASLAGMFFAWYHYRKREREARLREDAP